MRNGGWRICLVSPSRGGGRAGAGAASSQAPREEGRVWWQGEEANVDRGSPLKEVVMPDAVIIDAVRTPLGKGRPGGALAGVHPVDLLAHPLAALVERTGIDPRVIDDVIAGCFSQIGEQSTNIARRAAPAAGYPEPVPATTVVRPEESTSSTARPTSLTGSPRSEPEGEDAMRRLAQLVAAAAVVTIPGLASAQTLSEAQARAATTPLYVLVNQPVP